MNRVIYIILSIIASFLAILAILFYLTTPVKKDGKSVKFSINKGDAYSNIATRLKDEGLIRSELMYKVYIKFEKPSRLEVCEHSIKRGLSFDGIIKTLSTSCTENTNAVRITIPEGKNLEQVADIISKKINLTKEELIKVWTSTSFVDSMIEKYEFLNNDVKDSKIRYALEGYLFPSTYEFLNKEVSGETIAIKMLDQTSKIYNKNKVAIEKSNYSFHEIMTMASLVEYEAILDEDRALVAGVFYNREEANDRFGSCATLGYAINKWKLSYSTKDTQVDSPYNTYKYPGFPPGPGGMPSEKSIEAAINPAETKYYYFLANVCDVKDKKTYFSNTLAEHNQKKQDLLGCLR